MNKRLLHFDVVKALSIMWIFGVHYINTFRPSLFRFWNTMPTSMVLYGLSGKFATAMLAVILGYLAYSKGIKKGNLLSLVSKRYLSFFVMGLFINVIYAVHESYNFAEFSVLKEIILTSLVIGDRIYSTFWCMQSFFLASVISYINGSHDLSECSILLLIVIFMLIGQTWVAICLMGNLLYKMTDINAAKKYQKLLSRQWVQLLLLGIVFFAIKIPESTITHFIDGICCMLILTVIAVNDQVRMLFSNPLVAWLGQYSMGIFLLHPVVYVRLGGYLLARSSNSLAAFIITFVVCVCVTILLSIALVKLINWCTVFLFQLVMAIKKICVDNCFRFLEKHWIER